MCVAAYNLAVQVELPRDRFDSNALSQQRLDLSVPGPGVGGTQPLNLRRSVIGCWFH